MIYICHVQNQQTSFGNSHGWNDDLAIPVGYWMAHILVGGCGISHNFFVFFLGGRITHNLALSHVPILHLMKIIWQCQNMPLAGSWSIATIAASKLLIKCGARHDPPYFFWYKWGGHTAYYKHHYSQHITHVGTTPYVNTGTARHDLAYGVDSRCPCLGG